MIPRFPRVWCCCDECRKSALSSDESLVFSIVGPVSGFQSINVHMTDSMLSPAVPVPGFQYLGTKGDNDAPSPLLLVADGTWLILHDKELGQVNRFPLYETPMGVLVDDPVNLRDKVQVIEATEDLGIVRIKLVDREVPDEGWLGITFTEPPMMLRQWRIKDAQGGITALSLTDIRINRKLDPKLFVFTDPEPFSEN